MGRIIFSSLAYSDCASLALSISIGVAPGTCGSPMDHPVIPSMCPSTHQPSRMLRLGTPFSAAFIPLVPEASSGYCGVFSHKSTPEVICPPTWRLYSSRNTRSEEHTSELQSLTNLVCRLL